MPELEEKVILVTGGAGFIGSHFTKTLLAEGHRVVVLDALTYAGQMENLAEARSHPSLHFIRGNICDGQLILSLLIQYNVDYVVNFAAESHVDRSINNPTEFIETNIKGVFSLLNTSLQYWEQLSGNLKDAFRYLQISTDEVYGALGPEGKFSEDTAYSPNSPYSATKAGADHLVRAWYHTYGLPTLVTNCSNNYGPYQNTEKFIPSMITRALEGKTLPIYGDGNQVRDWIHVEDHCQGIWLAVTHAKPGSTYCFGGASERTNLEVVNSICQTLDQQVPRADGKSYATAIEFVTDRLGHDRRYAIDDSKAQRDLGFTRKVNFEAGLSSTVQWYKDRYLRKSTL
jgi:dTDP-glucose 4,6-dehydratase